MSRRRKALPPIPRNVDPQVRQWMESVKEQLEVGQGVRGDTKDTNITFGDLLESGIAKLKGRFSGPFNPGQMEPSQPQPDQSIPPQPQGFTGAAAIGVNSLIWQSPWDLYGNHSFTQILRAEGESSQLGQAVVIGVANGSFYSDFEVTGGVVYKYWIRFVSIAGIPGPPTASAGLEITALTRSEELLADLSGQIDESYLTAALNGRINLIDTAGTGILDRLGLAEGDLYDPTTGILVRHESLKDVVEDPVTGLPTRVSQTDFDSLSTIVDHPTTGLSARTLQTDFTTFQSQVSDDLTAKADAAAFSSLEAAVNDSATGLGARALDTRFVSLSSTIGIDPVTGDLVAGGRAESIDQISLELDDGSGGSRLAAIETTQLIQGEDIDSLNAQWSVKATVGDLTGGVGFFNNGATVDFGIHASRLWISDPTNPAEKVLPFIVVGGKVYIDTAHIREASIDEGSIGPITVGKLVDDAGVPITTIAGLIRIDAIETDSLVSVDGTFSGTVSGALIRTSETGSRFVIDSVAAEVFYTNNTGGKELRIRPTTSGDVEANTLLHINTARRALWVTSGFGNRISSSASSSSSNFPSTLEILNSLNPLSYARLGTDDSAAEFRGGASSAPKVLLGWGSSGQFPLWVAGGGTVRLDADNIELFRQGSSSANVTINGLPPATVATSSNQDLTDYPIGTILAVHATSTFNRNAVGDVRLGSNAGRFNIGSGGTVVPGTWRARGFIANDIHLFQKTAN